MSGMAMREYLLYDSESLKIATGPYPEVNLLDMLVFVKLNKLIIKSYWIPKVWKKSGDALYKSFQESERDLHQVALKVMSKKEIKKINDTILNWKAEHPTQYRVEKIRLGDFAQVASSTNEQKQEEGRGISLSNLLVDTRGAVQAVDQMVLVANRGIFLAQYLPALVRLQTRIGVQEVIDDVLLRMSSTKSIGETVQKARPVLTEMSSLSKDLRLLTIEANSLLKTYKEEFPGGVNATKNLQELHQIVDKSQEIIHDIDKSQDVKVIETLKTILREMALLGVLFIFIVCAIIFGFWWLGLQLFHRKKQHPL